MVGLEQIPLTTHHPLINSCVLFFQQLITHTSLASLSCYSPRLSIFTAENTIASFVEACKAGADGIETGECSAVL